MILSSLGGALVPLTVMPLWIRHVAPASPGYWAVTALEAALRDNAGRTFAASGGLLGFALAACLVAALRASRGWGRSAPLSASPRALGPGGRSRRPPCPSAHPPARPPPRH